MNVDDADGKNTNGDTNINGGNVGDVNDGGMNVGDNNINDGNINVETGHANNTVETGHALSLQPPPPSPSPQPPSSQNQQQSSSQQPPQQPQSSGRAKTIGQQRFQNIGKNTVSSIIGSYKSAVTKHAHRLGHTFAWQTRFYDHIIRDEKSFYHIKNYIKNNPINWHGDEFYEE